jgi:hypothetical protein
MTTNTTTPPTAATSKERKSPRKTIFSLVGITLLMTCMFVGFAYGAGTDKTQGCDTPTCEMPSNHIISCNSADGAVLGYVLTECPFCGENGFDKANDLQACQQFHGTAVSFTEPMTECGIKPSNPPEQ